MIDICFDNFQEQIRELHRQILEEKEKTLTEIITKYDFVMGSMELKEKLGSVLPEGANIAYSPYIEDPTSIYVIKRFDVMDYITFNTALALRAERSDIYE